jgi:hypothetical protein
MAKAIYAQSKRYGYETVTKKCGSINSSLIGILKEKSVLSVSSLYLYVQTFMTVISRISIKPSPKGAKTVCYSVKLASKEQS